MALAGLTVVAMVVVGSGVAAAATSWSAPQSIDPSGGGLGPLSCASATFCMASDLDANALTYSDGSWSSPQPTGDPQPSGQSSRSFPTAVSCPSASFCIAGDDYGRASTYSDGSWSSWQQIDGSYREVRSISCPSTSWCTAVDDDGTALNYSNGSWSPSQTALESSGELMQSISCPSTTFCMVVDSSGDYLTYQSGAWVTPQPVPGATDLISVSCASSSFCAAVDAASDSAFIYSSGTWSPAYTLQPPSNSTDLVMNSVSCPTTSFCVATDRGGAVFTYQNGTWDAGQQVDSTSSVPWPVVSCAAASFCQMVDAGGNAFAYGSGGGGGGTGSGGSGSGATGGGGSGSGGSSMSDNGAGIPAPTCATHKWSFGPFTAYASCFSVKRNGAELTAHGQVRLNGVDITAQGATEIDIKPLSETISATGPVSVSLGSLEIYRGALNLDLRGSFTLKANRHTKIKGLPVSGSFDMKPDADGMEVTAHAQLGASKKFNVSGDVHLTVTNQLGLELNYLQLKLGQIPIRQLLIKSASLTYERTSEGDQWTGEVVAQLPDGLPTVDGKLVILNGRLDDVGATVSGIDKPIGEVVFLQSLGLDVGFIPNLSVTGSVGLSAGPKLPILGVTALSLNASLEADFANPVVLTAKGNMQVGDKIKLSSAKAVWTVPSSFTFSGTGGFQVGSVKASVDGNGAANKKGFYFDATADLTLPLGTAYGKVYVSEKGVTGCAYYQVGPVKVQGAFGYRWGAKSAVLSPGGCNLAPYRSSASSALAHGAAASSTFHVPAGQTQATFGATGSGGYPTFTLRSPSGQTLNVQPGASGPLGAGGYIAYEDPGSFTTYVTVGRPAGGTWTLAPSPGSPAIASTGSALSLPSPTVSTRVRRAGHQMLLSWRTRPVAGQTLELSAVGANVDQPILETSKASGSIRFTPADDGKGDLRHIEIAVDRGGLPVATLTGARFRAQRPAAPGTPRGLRLTRRGSSVQITWGAAAHAGHYLVHVTTADGRDLYFQQPAGRRTVTITDVLAPDRVTVTVQAVTADGRASNPTHATARYSVRGRGHHNGHGSKR